MVFRDAAGNALSEKDEVGLAIGLGNLLRGRVAAFTTGLGIPGSQSGQPGIVVQFIVPFAVNAAGQTLELHKLSTPEPEQQLVIE